MSREHKSPFIHGLRGADLTARQRQFVLVLVRQGCTPTHAARQAGYSTPRTAAYDLLRTPHIQTAVAFERKRYVSGVLVNVATATLHAVMTDAEAPAAARVSAARTVFELAGVLGKGDSDAGEDRPLSEFTADELTRMIDKWTLECRISGVATETSPLTQ